MRGAGILGKFSLNKLIFALFCIFLRKKIIFAIATDKEATGGIKRSIISKLYKYVLDKSNYIVAQNKNQIKSLEKWRNKKFKNIKVIKNGFKIKNFDETKKNTILWVGKANRIKRPDYFLIIAKRLINESFIMICQKGSNKHYWSKILDSQLRIPNLKFYEFIPFNNIDEFFKNSKIFINTSIFEGFPNTFIQALKNKTPVISLNVDPDNILFREQLGFSCNGDLNKLEHKIKFLLKNQE